MSSFAIIAEGDIYLQIRNNNMSTIRNEIERIAAAKEAIRIAANSVGGGI